MPYLEPGPFLSLWSNTWQIKLLDHHGSPSKFIFYSLSCNGLEYLKVRKLIFAVLFFESFYMLNNCEMETKMKKTFPLNEMRPGVWKETKTKPTITRLVVSKLRRVMAWLELRRQVESWFIDSHPNYWRVGEFFWNLKSWLSYSAKIGCYQFHDCFQAGP